MSEESEKIELETPDLAAQKRAALEDLFPGVLADGVLDATRLGELLDTSVTAPTDGRERFGLMWAGKQDAVRSLLTPSRGTLVPELDKSIDFDNADHVFVEGDNLEVLKLLQKAYNDRVKLVYIDPPYNTGNDFVYSDDFTDTLRAYLEYTGQLDEEGNRTAAGVDVAGRRHSSWISMMYPRLALARNLLTRDGFLFVSINDLEAPTLRLMCNEIFGEDNFVEAFVWESIFRPSNMSRRVRRNAEYVLCYRRDASEDFGFVERLQAPQGEASLTQNNNNVRTLGFPEDSLVVQLPDGNYPKGPVGEVELITDLEVRESRAVGEFQIAGRFKWSQAYLDEEIAKGVYLVIKTNSFIPYYRKDYKQTVLRPTKILPRDLVGDVLQANAEVGKMIGEGIFDYPKPTSLIRFLMQMVGIVGDDLVLDFFAGSGTTGHAVMLENARDGGGRRSISVNLPEPTAPGSNARTGGFRSVADITRARLRSAAEATGTAVQGLRSYALAESNFGPADPAVEDGVLSLSAMTLKAEGLAAHAVATEVLLKEGVALDEAWEWRTAGGADVVTAGGVAVVLSTKITGEVVSEALAGGARVVVFLEDGFAGADAVKANAVTNSKNRGIALKTV